MEDLKRIERSVLARARRAKTPQDLATLRAETLGKKGALGLVLRTLGDLPPDERPKAGERINALKEKLEAALAERPALASAHYRRRDGLVAGLTCPWRDGRRWR